MDDRTRIISANDMHVIMTQFLNASKNIHIAMCRLDDNHAAQEFLNEALGAANVGVTQCLRLHESAKHRLAVDKPDPDEASQ